MNSQTMHGSVNSDGYAIHANATRFSLNGTVVAEVAVAGEHLQAGAARVSLVFEADSSECVEMVTTTGDDVVETHSTFRCALQGVESETPFVAAGSLRVHVTIPSEDPASTVELTIPLRTSRQASPSIFRVFDKPALRVLYARSRDFSGNWESEPLAIPVEIGLPRPDLLTAPPASAHSGLAHFEVACIQAYSDESSSSNSNNCVLRYEFDGRDAVEMDGSSTTTTPAELTLSSLPDGEHVITFTACTADLCSSTEWRWTVDTSEPDTFFESAPSAYASSQAANFEFSSNKAVVHFMCSIDRADEWLECGSKFSFRANDGAHTLQVAAVDMAGRVDATRAVFEWTVNTFAMMVPPCPEQPIRLPYQMFLLSTFNGHECVECLYRVRIGTQVVAADVGHQYVLDGLEPGLHNLHIDATITEGEISTTLQSIACNVTVLEADGSGSSASGTDATLTAVTIPQSIVLTPSVVVEFGVPNGFQLYRLVVQRADSSLSSDAGIWEPCPAAFELELPDGWYTLFVKAARPGLELPPQAYSWHQLASAAILQLVSSPPKWSEVPKATFTFNIARELPPWELWYSLDGEERERIWTTVDHPTLSLQGLGAGTHDIDFLLTFPGTDVISTLSYTWHISFAYPATELASAPPLVIPNTSVSLALECYINGSVSDCGYEYRIENAHTGLSLDEQLPVVWYPTQQQFMLHHLMEGENVIFLRSVQPATQLADHSPKSVVVRVDTTPPEVTIVAVSMTGSRFIWVSFGCSEESCKYQVLTHANQLPMYAPNPYRVPANRGDVALAVRAKDEAGNVGEWKNISSADLQMFLDSSIHFLATPPQYTDSTQARVLVAVSTEGLQSPVATYLLNGEVIRSVPATDGPVPFAFEELRAGKQVFQVVLKSANRPTSAKSFRWTVVWQAPRLALAEYPPATTHLDSAIFELEVEKPEASTGVQCEYSLDYAGWQSTECSKSLQVDHVAPGVHLIKVRARTLAAGSTPVVVSHAWMVSTNNSSGPPSQPFHVVAKPADRAALVSWNSPSDDGGRPITAYTIVGIGSEGSTPIYLTRRVTGHPCPTELLFRPLLNDVPYAFYVVAENELGVSERSRMSNAVKPYEASNPCALKSCSGKGTCMLTRNARGKLVPHCVCRPGYAGGSCETRTQQDTYGIIPSSWTSCDSVCGKGTRHRDLPCYQFRDGELTSYHSVDDDYCEQEKQVVPQEEVCRYVKCGFSVLHVEMQLRASIMDVGFSDAARRAFAENVYLEVSYALNIATERLNTFDMRRVDTDHVAISFDITTGSRDTELTLDTVNHLLSVHIHTRGSVLRSTGTWVRRLLPESATLELVEPGPQTDYSLALSAIQMVAVIGTSLFVTSIVVLCHHANPKGPYPPEPNPSTWDRICTAPCAMLWRLLYGCMRVGPVVVRYGELSSHDDDDDDDDLRCFTEDSPTVRRRHLRQQVRDDDGGVLKSGRLVDDEDL